MTTLLERPDREAIAQRLLEDTGELPPRSG